MNSTVSFKPPKAKQLARKEIAQNLPPKQMRRPLPCLLIPSFFYVWLCCLTLDSDLFSVFIFFKSSWLVQIIWLQIVTHIPEDSRVAPEWRILFPVCFSLCLSSRKVLQKDYSGTLVCIWSLCPISSGQLPIEQSKFALLSITYVRQLKGQCLENCV